MAFLFSITEKDYFYYISRSIDILYIKKVFKFL